jgi:hypothetical protein
MEVRGIDMTAWNKEMGELDVMSEPDAESGASACGRVRGRASRRARYRASITGRLGGLPRLMIFARARTRYCCRHFVRGFGDDLFRLSDVNIVNEHFLLRSYYEFGFGKIPRRYLRHAYHRIK